MRGEGWRKRFVGSANRLLSPLGPPIAIDFGVGSLKILQVEGGESPALIAAASVETPEDLWRDHAKRLAFQAEALPRLIKSGGFRGRRAVCAIPAPLSLCKHVQVQRAEGVPLRVLVEGAVSGQLGCSPAQLVMRCFEVTELAKAEGGARTEVICMAASRELVNRLMEAMQSARLQPVGIHSEFVAGLRSFAHISRRAEDQEAASLYLDLGAGSIKAMIAHGQKLVFAKRIDLGGHFLDAAVAKQLKCTMSDARRQRRELDERARSDAEAATREPPAVLRVAAAAAREVGEMPPESAPVVAIAEERRGASSRVYSGDLSAEAPVGFTPPRANLDEPLEMITDELRLCLRYHESVFASRPVQRAVFVGGEAMGRGLCQHIARGLRLPAQTADPLAGVSRTGDERVPGLELRRAQPGWAMVLGLCLSPTDL
ncbi:MAG: pilus assembly protein PilM [Phycisphaerae bacterium]|nr:pilus assembly protein PilM [Phycisphaerae bacterium]